MKKLTHIDGFKGFLCMMIMIGHYWAVYKYAEEAPAFSNRAFDFLKNNIIFKTILNEGFWLFAFFVISGFLLAFSSVGSVKELIARTVKRLLRFVLPIWGTAVFVFVIFKAIGFHHPETSEFFKNSWFQNNFLIGGYSLTHILREPWLVISRGISLFNTPYWVIKPMFFSSIYIYFCTWLTGKLPKLRLLLPLIFLAFAAFDTLFLSIKFKTLLGTVGFSCMLGYSIGFYKPQIDAFHAKSKPVFYCACVAVMAAAFALFNLNISVYVFSRFFTLFAPAFFFAAALIIIEKLHPLEKLFSLKPFTLLGKISFGIYSLHMAVLYSVGTLTLMALINRNVVSPAAALIIAWILCIIITFVLATLYRFVVEKPAGNITNKFYAKLKAACKF